MQEGDPILGGDANNVSGGQTPENGNVPSLSDTNSDSTAKDIDTALSSVTMPDSSESSDSSDPSELKISHDDSPIPPPVHILGQDITGITDEDFTPLPPNPEPTPQIIMPSGSPEVPAEPTAPEASTSPQTNTSSSTGAIPTAPNSTSTQAPGAETSVAPTVTTSAAAIPLQTAPQPIASTAPAPVQPESPAPESNYAAEFKQSVKASVSGESGDIILSKDPKDPKKTRKGLIIGIVIALIVVVGLCAGLGVVLSSNQKNNPNTVANTSSNPSQEAIEDFYKYANEVIYDKDSTEPVEKGLSQIDFEYKNKLINSTNLDKEYFKKIYNSYNDFYSKLDFNTIDSVNEPLYNITYDYKQLLDFLAILPTKEEFQQGYIMSVYIDEGFDEAEALVNELLASIPENNKYADQFRTLKELELSTTLDYIVLLDNEDCIVGNSIDSDCANQVDDGINEDEDMESILNNTYLEIREFLRKRYDEIGAGCYQIYDVLEGAYEQ